MSTKISAAHKRALKKNLEKARRALRRKQREAKQNGKWKPQSDEVLQSGSVRQLVHTHVREALHVWVDKELDAMLEKP